MRKRLFGLIKSGKESSANSLVNSSSQLEVKEFQFPNQDLLIISDKNPDDISVGSLLSISISISDGEIKFDNNESDDPSTIFLKLPIKKPSGSGEVEPLGYYPSYATSTLKQRWTYLNWLQDVTKEIDVGYVFIYYYGLERHLLTGNFDKAFNEILKLRKYHRNKSFWGYSESALINASLLMKRPDKLKELQELDAITHFSNSLFLIAHYNGYNLSIDNLMLIFDKIPRLNKRYLKKDRQGFQNILAETLNEIFSVEHFPFADKYDIEETTRSRYPLFANISLPDNIRAPDLPDFFRCERLVNDLKNVFELTHNKYKGNRTTTIE